MIYEARQGTKPSKALDILSVKQEAFAQLIAAGSGFAQAYREVYDTEGMSNNAIYTESHRLTTTSKIARRIASIIAEKEKENSVIAATRASRITQTLEDILETGTDSAKLRAAQLLGQIEGIFVDARKPRENNEPESLEDLEARLNKLLSK